MVRPIVADVRRRFEVAVAEAGQRELQRRVTIGVAAVAAEAAHVRDVRGACERFVAERPEVELLSAGRRLHSADDE